MRRRTFLATTVTAATSVTVSGCSAFEDEYEIDTDVINTFQRNGDYFATIDIKLHNNTEFSETLIGRLNITWDGYETTESVSAAVDGGSFESITIDATGPGEYDSHEADVRRL